MKVLVIGASGHIAHSPRCSVEKAKQLLGVEIKYSIMDIYVEYIKFNEMV
jgi:hypothetical protein